MKRIMLVLAPLVSSLLMAVQPAVAAPHAKVTPLTTEPLPEYPGKEVQMIVVDYPPGSVDPVHRHDAHAFVYVLDGSIVMGLNGGKEVTLHAGDTFHEGPEDVHTVGRNASSTKPAKFVVFLIKNKGAPVLTPVK
ncbi:MULTISPECIES: cupin domain-containing protein [Burkholderia]|uniref:Cupin domain-containing protein n=1 Tax=Burkholderia cepacia TaxID=292 RepID=A0A8I1ALG0_BURCE|nr:MULTISPECIES: cupin domain-containing protein [Burkholderia]ERJ39349.1 putative exported protein [Burkholderia sp. AU4i]KAB1589329.1 cupin domain-containing protein [Burkholderia cepacia]KML11563.1 cupin [Burkholderia cepacia]KMN54354.1 cupin [Burkholderia sp. LK4]KUY76812.1 cupin [Burkholderia cepacia]